MLGRVEQARPVHDDLLMVLEPRRRRDCLMLDRAQLSIFAGAERDEVDRLRPVDMAEHLLARQLDAHRTLQRQGRHHREEKLVLGSQSRAEAAANEGRHDPHIVLRQPEDAGDIGLAVLHALRLVVDGELAVLAPDHRRRMRLHRVVELRRDRVFASDPHRRGTEGGRRIASGLGRRGDAQAPLRRLVAVVPSPAEIRLVLGALVIDGHQRSGVARDVEALRHHECDRLAAILDLVAVERAKGLARRADHVLVAEAEPGRPRTVLMGEDLDYARNRFGGADVDRPDTPARDRAFDNVAMGQIGRRELGGIGGLACHLGRAVDAAAGRADMEIVLQHDRKPFTRCACRSAIAACRRRPVAGHGGWRGGRGRS